MEEEKPEGNNEQESPEVTEAEDIVTNNLLFEKLASIEAYLHTDYSKIQTSSGNKDDTINRLQKTVYEYEKGFIPSIKKPLIKDLILFRDSFNDFKKTFSEAAETLVKQIEFLDYELEEIFFTYDIEKIEVEGDKYDRNYQKVAKKIPTDDALLHEKVAAVTKPGYIFNNEILRKQHIAIYVYENND